MKKKAKRTGTPTRMTRVSLENTPKGSMRKLAKVDEGGNNTLQRSNTNPFFGCGSLLYSKPDMSKKS